MKKLILIILFIPIMFLVLDPASQLLSRFLRLEQPTFHEINRGDWLSKIALKYYGDASFWRELALINRAPDGDLIFPGEKIIVPSYSIIQKIRKARSLSRVNSLIEEQQAILAGNYRQPEESPGDSRIITVPEHNTENVKEKAGPEEKTLDVPSVGNRAATEISRSSGFPFWWIALGVTGILIIGIVMYFMKKKKSQEIETFGAGEDEEVDQDEKNIFMEDFKESRTDKKEVNLIG